jgi:hypothetical protein
MSWRFLQLSTVVTVALLVACGTPSGPQRDVDLDGDGVPDGLQYDLDGDGVWDAVDEDGDGTWEAGDFDGDGVITDFSDLGTGYQEPTAEQLAGWSADVDPDFADELDPGAAGSQDNVVTRTSVDLSGDLPPVLNQGQLGSCAAFATTLVGSLARSRAQGAKVLTSAAFLYERMLTASNSTCRDGTFLHTGLETLMREGAPLADEVPYSDQACASGSSPGPNGHLARIGGFSKLEPFNRARVKEVLSSGTPVVFGCTLPPNFMEWAGPQASGVFRSAAGQAGGPHGGGHAMVLVGYDDARGAWRVQNSWGADWGDRGSLWWDYDDLEARGALHALVPQMLPNGMAVPPDATAASLTMEATGAVQLATADGPLVVVRLRANAQVQLTSLAAPALGASATYAQPLIYGDVALPLADAAPAGPYDLEVGGTLGGASFSRTVRVTLGEPLADPD